MASLRTESIAAAAPRTSGHRADYAARKIPCPAFASDVHDPSALAFDDAGNLYYSELVDGSIVRLRDADGDGVADEKKIFASGFNNPRGLAWHDGKLYVSSRGQINTLRDTTGDGVADENEIILDNLFHSIFNIPTTGLRSDRMGNCILRLADRVGQLELKDQTYWHEGQARRLAIRRSAASGCRWQM